MLSEITKLEGKGTARWFAALTLLANLILLGGLWLIIQLNPNSARFYGSAGVGTMALLAFLGLNVLMILEYRETERDYADTLKFILRSEEGDFAGSTAAYLSIIKTVEGYLARNRINHSISFEGRRFGGRLLPYSKVFTLENYDLKLRVKRELGTRGPLVASVLLGKVSSTTERVARNILEGIRRDLEISREK